MKSVKTSVDNAESRESSLPCLHNNSQAISGETLTAAQGSALAGASESKFWGRIKETPVGCWEWRGANNRGYGVLSVRTKYWRVTRLVHIIFHGRLKKGEEICHRCDNPACCNPAHMFAGTHSDNMQDASDKGRSGAKRGTRRMTLAKVVAMRADYATGAFSHQQLADKYGAYINNVGSILRGETWVKRQGRPPLKGVSDAR